MILLYSVLLYFIILHYTLFYCNSSLYSFAFFLSHLAAGEKRPQRSAYFVNKRMKHVLPTDLDWVHTQNIENDTYYWRKTFYIVQIYEIDFRKARSYIEEFSDFWLNDIYGKKIISALFPYFFFLFYDMRFDLFVIFWSSSTFFIFFQFLLIRTFS